MTDMLIQYLEAMAEIAIVWGPILVVIFMTVESSFVPFPSEVVMIPAGFMAARGEFPPGDPTAALWLAILMGTAGSLLGAWINYSLSYFLGRPFLERYGKYFFLKPAALHRAEDIFREYGNGTTFICRFLPGIRQLISIPAGVAGMRPASFTFFTGLGAGIWVAVLTFMGYYFGNKSQDMSWEELVHHGKDIIHEYRVWIVLGCGAALSGYVWLHKQIMHSKETHAAPAAVAVTPGAKKDGGDDQKPRAPKKAAPAPKGEGSAAPKKSPKKTPEKSGGKGGGMSKSARKKK